MFAKKNLRVTSTVTIVAVLTFLLFSVSAHAMGSEAHNTLAMKLLNTPPGNGGAASISQAKVGAINKWMDYPARQLGEYTIKSTDDLLTPWNHRMLRHNPARVAKAMSGTGRLSLSEMNVARAHKVADVLTTKSKNVLTDGWKVTPRMRRQAAKIVDTIEKKGRLPKKLPAWVDRSRILDREKVGVSAQSSGRLRGFVLRGGGVVALTTVVSGTVNAYQWRTGELAGRTALVNVGIDDASAGSAWIATEGLMAGVGGKVILAVQMGAGTGVAYFMFETTKDALNALRGSVRPSDLPEKFAFNCGKGLMAGLGTGVIIVALSNPGTGTIVVVSAGTVIATEFVASKLNRALNYKARAARAYFAKLPMNVRKTVPTEWVDESTPLRGFGASWGPQISTTSGNSEFDATTTSAEKSSIPALW